MVSYLDVATQESGSRTLASIISSVNTSPGDYPFMASLRRFQSGGSDAGGAHFCGGALISKNIVLTSAVCASYINVHNIEVHLGRYYREGDDEGRYKAFNVTESKIHPKYDGRTGGVDFDVALLVLDGESTFAPVDFISSEEELDGKKIGTLLAWGLVVPGRQKGLSDRLLQAEIPLVSREDCRKFDVFKDLITESMICAGGEGKDACQSDAGSPLIIGRKVVGLVSWGLECGGKEPGVYASVGAVADWIKSQI